MNIVRQAWKTALSTTKADQYKNQALQYVDQEIQHGHIVYPPRDTIFHSLDYTQPKDIRVVILGQDPYHQPGQAHGLCFSVPIGVSIPASLRNILQEVQNNTETNGALHGSLEGWAQQGVLLLNTTLTVRAGEPMSHKGIGWEEYTDCIIKTVSNLSSFTVFMLWGKHAQSKQALINKDKHVVLMAPHPSPLSAYRGFLGCNHFTIANNELLLRNLEPIDWSQR